MQVLNNLSSIPFYETKHEQDRYKWYAYGEKYRHYAPSNALLPFYIILPKSNPSLHYNLDSCEIELFQVCGCSDEQTFRQGSFSPDSYNESYETMNGEFKPALASNGLSLIEGTSYDILIYYASGALDLGLSKGIYYLDIKITDGEETPALKARYFSELLTVEDSATLSRDKVRLEWRCEDDIEYNGGIVPFSHKGGEDEDIDFKLVVYLDAEIAMPEYAFTDEGEERGGYFYPTKQISEKVYKMRFVAPEFVCDVLRIVPMADYANIRFTINKGRNGSIERNYTIGSFETSVEWLEQGYYADVSCSFKTDTLIKKVGKAYNI